MHYQESAKIVLTALFNALDELTKGRVDAFPKLFAPEGVFQFPFAPEDYTAEIVGPDAIANYLAKFPETFSITAIHKDAVYVSENGLIVEFHVDGHGVKTGAPYPQRYVGVIHHADGKVLRYRDYWNPIVALTATGGLDALHQFGGTKSSATKGGR